MPARPVGCSRSTITRLFGLGLVMLVVGCAGVRLEGTSGPVAWRATDLALAERQVGDDLLWVYSFVLVLRETTGTGIDFTAVRRSLYFRDPNTTGSSGEMTGRWRLAPNGEFRFSFSSSLRCTKNGGGIRCREIGAAPVWQFVFIGTSDAGQPVRLVVDLALPQDPR